MEFSAAIFVPFQLGHLDNQYSSGDIIKLHSDLRVLTQLQLDGVGVDFVFVWKEEGSRRRKEEPTPGFSLNFGGCPVGVMRFSCECLEGVWMVVDQVRTGPVRTV